MIPIVNDVEIIRQYGTRADGVLLPGSPTDIDPVRYGAEPDPKLGKLYPERDATDFALLEHVESSGKPILGVCFGVQSLNVYRGGTLIQDIPSRVTDPVVHDKDEGECARHLIKLSEESLIARLAGSAQVEVNSYHHQSIERPGTDLRAVAFAPDGVIEAVEDTRGRFIIGVQWHPERDFRDDPLSQKLFKAFIQATML